MPRTPNCKCQICGKEIYRRPYTFTTNKGRVFCSSKCFGFYQSKPRACPICGVMILNGKRRSKTCSKSCGTKLSRKSWSTKSKKTKGDYTNCQDRIREVFKREFDIKHCMVEGCTYNTTYDIHRLIHGKDGGKYEIGNAFAICPNHHAEIHRKIISVEKIDNKTLRVINKQTEQQIC